MGVQWKDDPQEIPERDLDLNTPSRITWKVPEADVSASGVATAYLSGMSKSVFDLTGGSSLEFFLDELIPENSLAMHSIKTGGGKAIDWGKDHTLVNYEPQNSAERVAERAGEDLVLGGAMAAAIVSTGGASTMLPAVAKTSLPQRVLSSILSTFRKNPLTASILEMTASSAAGAGMQMVEEGGGGPAKQAVGGLAGAMVPVAPILAYKGLSYTALGLFSRLYQKSSKKAFEEVAKALDTGIGDMSDIAKSNKVMDELGITKRPSVAEASNSPQLIARQRQIESEAVGSELDNYVRLHREKTADLEGRSTAVGPEENFRDAETVIDVSRARLEAQRSAVSGEISDVESLISVTGRRLPEATDRIASGRALKEIRDTIRTEVKDGFSEEADNIGLNDLGSEFDATSFRDSIRAKFFDKRSKFAAKIKNKNLKLINRMKEEVDANGKPTGQVKMTWEDLTAIRESLDDDISVLMSTGQKNKARPLIQAKSMLDNFVENNAPNNVDAMEWSSFRARYKTEFIERFEKGTAYKVSGANRRGEYFTNEEMVADSFLRNESTVADFFRLYGGSAEEALPHLRTAILDRARTASVVDGVVNEKALAKFIETGPLSKVLRSFPAVRQELTDIRSATKALSLRSAELKARANAIESSSLAKILELSGDPEAMIEAALRDLRKMNALVTASQSAGLGRRPVASLVWQRAIGLAAKDGEPTPDQLLKFIKSHRQSLNIALGETHAKNLRLIYEASEIFSRVSTPSGSVEPFRKRHMMFESAMRFYGRFAGRKAKALMKEALYDENIARDIQRLMETPSLTRSQKLQSLPEQRLNAALFTMGLGESKD
jgi:hypothetical protein